ncbi:hypothetical protein ACOCJ7_04010 [Knoellia sp. CPCC 206453]|uniref:hypothetical protein n=1 Tax=Knoellia pratensis TaxID=3404796 RepID=UPI003607F9FF
MAHKNGHSDGSATPELLTGLRTALRAKDFTEFLVIASVLGDAGRDYDAQPAPEGWASFVDSMIEVNYAETTALLHVIAATTPDDIERRHIRRALATRRQPTPTTVTGLAEAQVDAAYFMGDELGDGDNVILGITWPTGERATAVAYIDHNMGTIVKDGFFIGEPVEAIVDRFIQIAREAGDRSVTPVPTDLADSRARIEQGLANLDDFLPDWEQDGWPLCRSLLEFFVRTLPAGGTGYAGHAAYDVDVTELVETFLNSLEARSLSSTRPTRDAAAALLEFAVDHSGDALRWSPVSVEVCLVNELPLDPELTEQALDAVPDVLPALVRYAHRELRISPGGTTETLQSVTRWLPRFQLIRGLGANSAVRDYKAHLAAARTGPYGPANRAQLVETLGSEAAVDALDDVPLPDEPLDLDGITGEARDRVLAIAVHLDRLIDEGPFDALGVEFRTACRRFLTGVARHDPDVVTRRSKDANTAAAIAWLLARANDLIGEPPSRLRAGELWSFFAVSSPPSTRAETLARTYTNGRTRSTTDALGDPALLVGRYRRRLLELREECWPVET